MIRMDLSAVRIIGRTTQGVRLINLNDTERVVSIDSVAKDNSEDDEEAVEGEGVELSTETEVTPPIATDDITPETDGDE
jgi:DNA gyrase subunit A